MNETEIDETGESGTDGEPTVGENVTKEVMKEMEPELSEGSQEMGPTPECPESKERNTIRKNEKLHLVKRGHGIAIKVCSSMNGGYLDMTIGELRSMYEEIENLLDD